MRLAVVLCLIAAPTLAHATPLDDAIRASWAKANISPAPAASDGEFLRRVTLDLAGRVPTRAEVAAYHGDKAALVDKLLSTADYAEHWADVYEGLLVGRAAKLRADGRNGVHEFLAGVFAKNLPFDEMARRILDASGPVDQRGEAGFVAAHLAGGGSPEAAAGATARIFLGLQIQCAQCHDHPYDKRYKQEDFWGLAAFFARTKTRPFDLRGSASVRPPLGEASRVPPMGMGQKTLVVFDVPKGQAIMKKHGTNEDVVVAPKFLGRDPAHAFGDARRTVLAREVVASDLFAKAAVNRTWAELFGRGIVDPWDDLGGENDEHPAALKLLAADFVAHKYDFRALLREIVLSEAYGRAAAGGSDDAEKLFARAAVRPRPPEALFRSLVVAAGLEDAAAKKLSPEEIQKKLAQGLKQFVYVFGDDEMGEVDRGSGTVQQALLLFNGEVANSGARAVPGGVLRAILDETKDPARRLEAMFAAAYARAPTDAERAALLPKLGRAETYEDLYFAMLTSSEFICTH